MPLGALNVHLEHRETLSRGHAVPLLQSREAESRPSQYLFLGLRLQVPRAHVLLLQLVGQSQDLDVGGRQARVVPGLLGELRH